VHHVQVRPSSPEELHVKRHERPLLLKDGITGEKWPVILSCDYDAHLNHRVLLHAANLRHGTDSFTSPPKKGMVWIFSPENSTVSVAQGTMYMF
jgi:hypothetical protein